MMIRQALPLLALVMLWSPSWSCPAPTKPLENAKYSTILLGEVVGVRLTDYAAARKKQILDGAKHPLLSDASPGYEIECSRSNYSRARMATAWARSSRCEFLRAAPCRVLS